MVPVAAGVAGLMEAATVTEVPCTAVEGVIAIVGALDDVSPLRVKVANPVAVLPVGGTSLEPNRIAV